MSHDEVRAFDVCGRRWLSVGRMARQRFAVVTCAVPADDAGGGAVAVTCGGTAIGRPRAAKGLTPNLEDCEGADLAGLERAALEAAATSAATSPGGQPLA